MNRPSIIATLILLPLTAIAQEADPASDSSADLIRFFNNMDHDGNGRVTHEEFEEFWKRLFDREDRNDDGLHDQTEILRGRHFEIFDINKDGVITFEEEFSVRNRHWKHFDTTGRGWISLDEFVARGRGRVDPDSYDYETTFTKMDADRDGLLTRKEYLAFWKDYFDSRDADNDELLSNTEHAHADSFDSFDTDNDGKIARDEDAHVREKDFKGLDRDRDGSLTQAEFVR